VSKLKRVFLVEGPQQRGPNPKAERAVMMLKKAYAEADAAVAAGDVPRAQSIINAAATEIDVTLSQYAQEIGR
jgi:hypothetical protein